MNKHLNFHKILFLDIETVPAYKSFDEVPKIYKALWNKKAKYLKKEVEDTPESLYGRAGIYSEFGKIICISVGFIDGEKFRIKSFFGEEKKLLIDFADLLNQHYNKPDHLLCGHNAKEFDFPYIARRMLINRIPLPEILDVAGTKPWEVRHIDTMQLWRFGDYKNYTSLELLAAIFNIPTPKDDIDGSMIAKVYYVDNDIDRIVTYCQKDTLTVAQVLLSFMNKELIQEENVVMV